MAEFKLNLADYAALAGLMLFFIGAGALVNEARIDATEARIVSDQRSSFEELDGKFDDLTDSFDESTTAIEAIVRDGLRVRTDEVALSIARLGEAVSEVTMTATNFPVDSSFYGELIAMSSDLGADAQVITIGNIATARVLLQDLTGPRARRVQALFDRSSEEPALRNLNIAFEIGKGAIWRSQEEEKMFLQTRIMQLEDQIDALEGSP